MLRPRASSPSSGQRRLSLELAARQAARATGSATDSSSRCRAPRSASDRPHPLETTRDAELNEHAGLPDLDELLLGLEGRERPVAIAIGVAAAAQLGLQVLAGGAATTDARLRRELDT